MIEFMNFDTTRFPNFGSGLISRFSALWRRDIVQPSITWVAFTLLRLPSPRTRRGKSAPKQRARHPLHLRKSAHPFTEDRGKTNRDLAPASSDTWLSEAAFEFL